ncbi:MAG: hypothetical protein QXD66_00030 [Candidatus Nezhaarchaeales archaeon]
MGLANTLRCADGLSAENVVKALKALRALGMSVVDDLNLLSEAVKITLIGCKSVRCLPCNFS